MTTEDCFNMEFIRAVSVAIVLHMGVASDSLDSIDVQIIGLSTLRRLVTTIENKGKTWC